MLIRITHSPALHWTATSRTRGVLISKRARRERNVPRTQAVEVERDAVW